MSLDEDEEELKTFYATFGFSQSLAQCYVKVRALSYQAAHQIMTNHYGTMWAFLYPEDELLSAIHRYGLVEVPLGTRNERIGND